MLMAETNLGWGQSTAVPHIVIYLTAIPASGSLLSRSVSHVGFSQEPIRYVPTTQLTILQLPSLGKDCSQ